MSNVGPHGNRLLEHEASACQSGQALRAVGEVSAGRPSFGGRRTVAYCNRNEGKVRAGCPSFGDQRTIDAA
jgi:hypothetical protein